MESFNTVPDVGSFGQVVSVVNANFQLAYEELQKIGKKAEQSRGLFPSVAALTTAYPTPKAGEWAYVGNSFPVAIYECVTAGVWENSGATWNGESVDLTNYALKADTQDLLAKIGYFTAYNQTGDAAISITAPGFRLTAGGCMRIKMVNAVSTSTVTLNINSSGAKTLYYNGLPASIENSWSAGEVIEVYYDGTQYQSNVVNWRGVDDEPTAGSDNLVKSGGVVLYNDKVSAFERVFNDHKNFFIEDFVEYGRFDATTGKKVSSDTQIRTIYPIYTGNMGIIVKVKRASQLLIWKYGADGTFIGYDEVNIDFANSEQYIPCDAPILNISLYRGTNNEDYSINTLDIFISKADNMFDMKSIINDSFSNCENVFKKDFIEYGRFDATTGKKVSSDTQIRTIYPIYANGSRINIKCTKHIAQLLIWKYGADGTFIGYDEYNNNLVDSNFQINVTSGFINIAIYRSNSEYSLDNPGIIISKLKNESANNDVAFIYNKDAELLDNVQMEVGGYDSTTGAKYNSSTLIRTDRFINVPSAKTAMKAVCEAEVVGVGVFYYDEDFSLISTDLNYNVKDVSGNALVFDINAPTSAKYYTLVFATTQDPTDVSSIRAVTDFGKAWFRSGFLDGVVRKDTSSSLIGNSYYKKVDGENCVKITVPKGYYGEVFWYDENHGFISSEYYYYTTMLSVKGVFMRLTICRDDYGNITSEYDMVTDVHVSLSRGRLFGKKMSILGDSLSTYGGVSVPANANYYPRGTVSKDKRTWFKQLAAEMGLQIEVVNAISSSCVSGNSQTYIPLSNDSRLEALGNPDIIVVQGGTNDIYIGKNSGKWGGTDINGAELNIAQSDMWELGRFDSGNGNKVNSLTQIRTKEKMAYESYQTIVFTENSNSNRTVYFWKYGDYGFIGYDERNIPAGETLTMSFDNSVRFFNVSIYSIDQATSESLIVDQPWIFKRITPALDMNDFTQAYTKVLVRLHNLHPNAILICLSPCFIDPTLYARRFCTIERIDDIINAERFVCEMLGGIFIDIRGIPQINYKNITGYTVDNGLHYDYALTELIANYINDIITIKV